MYKWKIYSQTCLRACLHACPIASMQFFHTFSYSTALLHTHKPHSFSLITSNPDGGSAWKPLWPNGVLRAIISTPNTASLVSFTASRETDSGLCNFGYLSTTLSTDSKPHDGVHGESGDVCVQSALVAKLFGYIVRGIRVEWGELVTGGMSYAWILHLFCESEYILYVSLWAPTCAFHENESLSWLFTFDSSNSATWCSKALLCWSRPAT